MKTFGFAISVVMLCAVAGFCGRAVVFIGLSEEGGPGIEKNLTRLFQGYLAMSPEVHAIDNDEVRRLQARIGHYPYPAMTAPLAVALKRFAPDSALVIRGMVRSCSIRPIRRYFFGAAIKGELTIELTIYNLSQKTYAYIGDARAVEVVDKGFFFWFGDVENAIEVSAIERTKLLDKLQEKAVSSCGRILQAVLLSERSNKNIAPGAAAGIGVKKVEVASSPELQSETMVPGDQADTAELQIPDSAGNAPPPDSVRK